MEAVCCAAASQPLNLSLDEEMLVMTQRCSFLLSLFTVWMALALAAGAAPRIVSIGGPVTEIVYALGAGAHVVGVDTSSTYPEAATQLPQVGYQRRLSAEGVLSLQPDVVLATSDAGPPVTLAHLEAVVEVVEIPAVYSISGAEAKIRLIAQTLGREDQGEQLVGTLYVSGTGTAADVMIRLAGGVNAVTEYEDFKPFTPEAVVAAAPDVLLMLARGLDSLGGIDGLVFLSNASTQPCQAANGSACTSPACWRRCGKNPETASAACCLTNRRRAWIWRISTTRSIPSGGSPPRVWVCWRFCTTSIWRRNSRTASSSCGTVINWLAAVRARP